MAQKKTPTAAGQVVTLADLAPRHDVMGGNQKRVFGSDRGPSDDNERRDQKSARTAKRTKDRPPKSGVKGGGHNLNDNLTLVRGAKPTPTKKDLPPRKDVTGGGKVEKIILNDNLTLVRTGTRGARGLRGLGD